MALMRCSSAGVFGTGDSYEFPCARTEASAIKGNRQVRCQETRVLQRHQRAYVHDERSTITVPMRHQTSQCALLMSAFGGKADIAGIGLGSAIDFRYGTELTFGHRR